MRAQRGHAHDWSETGSNPPARKAGHKSLFHGIHPTALIPRFGRNAYSRFRGDKAYIPRFARYARQPARPRNPAKPGKSLMFCRISLLDDATTSREHKLHMPRYGAY